MSSQHHWLVRRNTHLIISIRMIIYHMLVTVQVADSVGEVTVERQCTVCVSTDRMVWTTVIKERFENGMQTGAKGIELKHT